MTTTIVRGEQSPRPDPTRNERQRRRTQQLNEIAQAAGFETWRKLETAVLKGEVKITKGENL